MGFLKGQMQGWGGHLAGSGLQTSAGWVARLACRLETFSCVVFWGLSCSCHGFTVTWEMQATVRALSRSLLSLLLA